jgi:hypothetical protein
LGLAQSSIQAIAAGQMVISERFTPPSRENLRSQQRIAERPYDHGGLFRISRN